MDNKILNDVLWQFDIPMDIEAYGNGHINDTYLVNPHKYILQRINISIFKNPDELMENIENVTAFLRKLIIASGGNPDRETLTVIPTKDGRNYYRLDDRNVFRVYKFIADTKSIENSKTPEDLYEAGVGFGHFQKLLADFPVEKLHETIRDFHHTPKRVEALKEAIRTDAAGRAESVKEEIAFALENAAWADTVVKGIENGSIPVRVTHNDTKINNILFDEETGKAVCVIDLDTVMPGSMLYDFGDALRMGGSTAAEDETDLNKVWFDITAFEAFAKGYLSEMKDSLTKTELELLPLSVKLLTYECGVRFLTDYLNGDTYFKIHREHHNLDRARNQFKLVADIAGKEKALTEIVEKVCGNGGMYMENQVFTLNYPWDVNGYKPKADFHLSVDDKGFHMHIKVKESNPRREETEHQSAVCKDSCVEWFVNFLPEACDRYFNFEVNPNGAMHAAFRKDRYDYQMLKNEDIAEMEIEAAVYSDTWEVKYTVPFSLIARYIPDYRFREGMEIRANFYKCGDSMPFPHYGMWNEFRVEKPDFHRPEYFGRIILK